MRVEEALGRVVRRHRVRAGLSQESLAHTAQLSTVYVSEIERGRRKPSVTVVVQLAEVLGVSAGKLVDEAVALSKKARST